MRLDPVRIGTLSASTPAGQPIRHDGVHNNFDSTEPPPDMVNHPPHYQHPSGVECITVTEEMNFCIGNAVKYLWRADAKHDPIADLRKARWYIDREIARRQK